MQEEPLKRPSISEVLERLQSLRGPRDIEETADSLFEDFKDDIDKMINEELALSGL